MILINCSHSRQETQQRIKSQYDQAIVIMADDTTGLQQLTAASCVCVYADFVQWEH